MPPDSTTFDALEDSLTRHGGFVRSVARRLVAGEDRADDVVQQTCLAALRHPPSADASLKGWLRTVARRFAARLWREDTRRARRECAAARPEATLSAAELVERQLAIREVIDAVMTLAEPYRSAIMLRYYEDLEPAEIAARLGVPAATVRTRIHRGLEQLRERLDAAHGGERASWMASLAPVAFGTFGAGGATAAVATTLTAAGAASAPAWLPACLAAGGLLMAKKAAIAVAALAAVVTVSVFVLRRDPAPRNDAPAGTVSSAPAASGGTVPAAIDASTDKTAPISSAPFVDTKKDAASREPSGAGGREATARIRGRLVDESGRPVADARVTLASSQVMAMGLDVIESTQVDDSGRDVRTDAEGRFAFGGVRVGAVATVRARPEQLCDSVRRAEISKAGDIDLGDLVAKAGGSIAGIVRGDGGAPQPGARISAVPMASPVQRDGILRIGGLRHADGRTATANERGEFRLDGLEEGDWSLEARAEKHTPALRDGVKVGARGLTRDVEIVLKAGLSLAGVVRDEAGRPIAGANVSVGRSVLVIGADGGSAARSAKATTDAQGRFEVHGLESAGYFVRASKAGYTSRSAEDVAPGTDVVLTLPPGAVVHGRVHGGRDGKPLSSFDLRLASSFPPSPAAGRVLTSAQAAEHLGVEEPAGLFALTDLQAGEVGFTVKAPGFAETTVGPLTLEAGQRLAYDVTLEPEASVSGKVLGPDGQPIAGAVVRLTAAEAGAAPAGESVPGTRVKRTVRARASDVGDWSQRPIPIGGPVFRSVTTEADGSFDFVGLGAGGFRIQATHKQHAGSPDEELALTAGKAVEGVVLKLQPGGAMAGRAFDDQGKPLPGVRVVAHLREAESEPFGGGGRSTTTDASGAFELTGLSPGTWTAKLEEIQAAGNMIIRTRIDGPRPEEPGEVAVEVKAGETAAIDLRMPARGSVAGFVSEAGKPAAGLKVTLRSADSPLPLGAVTATTDEAGLFVFRGVALGDYLVSVQPPEAALAVESEVSVVASREHRADVALPTGAIEGRVVDVETKKGVGGVVISLAKPTPGETREVRAVMLTVDATGDAGAQTIEIGTPGPAPVKTDEDGRYRIRYVGPGDYDVTIKGKGLMRDKKSGVHVDAGYTARGVDFEAKRGATLVVSVDPSNEDLPFVIGHLFALGQEGVAPDTQAGSPKKPLRFDGLAPGAYRIRVESMMDGYEAETEVTLASGAEVPLTLKLKKKV